MPKYSDDFFLSFFCVFGQIFQEPTQLWSKLSFPPMFTTSHERYLFTAYKAPIDQLKNNVMRYILTLFVYL